MSAQSVPRRAVMTGGGSGDSGKCTIEVVVDGTAEVEIRGDNAVLRNVKGQPPQWRRFECNGVLPANPADFRFAGVDGRGRQDLVTDPRRGGVAVIRIDDPPNGQEGYTFDIFWGNGRGGFQNGPDRGGPDRGRPDDRRPFPTPNRRFTTEQAVSACQDAVREQAGGRFRQSAVEFLRTNLDDQPGRNDWVVGALAVRRGGQREIYRFSCSVNFDSGRVRSADIQQVAERDDRGRDGDRRGGPDLAINNCRRAVEDRLRTEGLDRIEFQSINPARNELVVGNVRAEGRNRTEFREFTCAVDMRDGNVRSVDLRRPR